ncbi:hypothetical protein DQG23_12215 [Paenibacillus contaminans]|uniref:Uncharacterized protein n=1 Tax=Paenibacillus contaminans TaxID=450362 RepID=A0A329MLP5_9BACL|nr:hypothetical protein DQG23_12215 [Paenibacillus contaminans]
MKILSINNHGLVLRDEHNNERFIDFAVCNENWIEHHRRIKNLNDEDVNELRVRSRCIGQRDICGKPPYFEFFTCPTTKIEFTSFWAKRRFREWQRIIVQAGWSTFDLS